jgi:isoleucyl-tRNA synthetase
VIWTTTPWTLPANQAVALHAEIDYQLVQVQSERGTQNLILAKDLVESACERYKLENQKYWLILLVRRSKTYNYNIH